MILSIIAVAFYALVWLNNKHGGTLKICKKKKKKKTLLTDGADTKVDLGGKFPSFGMETETGDLD